MTRAKLNLLQVIRNLWRRPTVISPETKSVGKIRLDEHSAGWILTDNDVAIARLEFLRKDPPLYRFEVSYLREEERAKQLLRCSSKRDPVEKVFYVNTRQSLLKVGDAYFWSRLREDGLVAIRDMRPS